MSLGICSECGEWTDSEDPCCGTTVNVPGETCEEDGEDR
jgi:hypothetical protein